MDSQELHVNVKEMMNHMITILTIMIAVLPTMTYPKEDAKEKTTIAMQMKYAEARA
jgi:hypothetical protein